MRATLPPNEVRRLDALRAFDILDTPTEQGFDDLVQLASHICGTPIAMVSLVDRDREWFKAKVGVSESESPRDFAFCAHGILQQEVFEVTNALTDERFANNPAVTGESKIRFYAGAPLITSDGQTLGMLCVKDRTPRELTSAQKDALQALSRQVVAQLEMRRCLQELRHQLIERVVAEKSRHESEEKFRQMAENITAVFWMTSPDLQQTYYVSPAYEKIWGRSVERTYSHPQEWIEAILPEDRERTLATFARLTSDTACVTCEFRILRADGDVRWIFSRGVQIRNQEGKLTRLTGLSADITEQKRADEKVRLLSSAVEQSDDSIVITDARADNPDPKIIFVNAAFTALTGYTATEIVGQSPRVLEGPLTSRLTVAQMRRNLARGKSFRGETINYRKDRSTIHLEWQVGPIHNEQGTTTHFVAFQRDISARKATERDLAQAREDALESTRLKSRFLANMSHELRTPLNAINGLSSAMVEQDLPQAARESAALILQCGESLLENIQTILTHSSLEAGKTELESKPFDLATVLLNALRITGDAAQRKGVKLDYFLEPATPARLRGDPFRLQQVLVNLLANAIKFTDRGQVSLRLRSWVQPNGHWKLRFSVADTGIGVTSENRRKLFQPFSQADDSTTRRFEGTGLGLVIVKSVVELMGGSITVRSRLGTGSIFSFTIVLPAMDATPAIFASGAHPDLIGKQVLITEPDPIRQRLLLALAQSWRLQAHVSLQPVESDRFDFAIARFSDSGSTPTTRPTVWLCRPDQIPSASHGSRSIAVKLPLNADELSAALVSLLKRAPALRAAPPTRNKLGTRLPLKILAADDILTNREALKYILRHHGYEIDLVENGAEVLQRLDAHSYDLILLDVQMPVLDGLSAAREICRRFPDTTQRPRMVAITASAQPGDRDRCLDAGMDEYLSKPIRLEKIASCIEQLFVDRAAPAVGGTTPPTSVTPPAYAWVDRTHLHACTEGMDADSAQAFLWQLYTTSKADFALVRDRLIPACEARDRAQLATHVHGLKGCVMMLGWTRLAAYCSETLILLRSNQFESWNVILVEIDRLYAASVAEFEQMLSEP